MQTPDVKYLKIVLGGLALIPLVTGVISMLGIDDPLYGLDHDPHYAVLDSNLRFFGGVWFTIGAAIFATLNHLEERNPLLQWLLGAVFMGGIGRLISMVALAIPPIPFVAFTILEIVIIPLIMLWQRRLASSG